MLLAYRFDGEALLRGLGVDIGSGGLNRYVLFEGDWRDRETIDPSNFVLFSLNICSSSNARIPAASS